MILLRPKEEQDLKAKAERLWSKVSPPTHLVPIVKEGGSEPPMSRKSVQLEQEWLEEKEDGSLLHCRLYVAEWGPGFFGETSITFNALRVYFQDATFKDISNTSIRVPPYEEGLKVFYTRHVKVGTVVDL